ncbi:PQQ-dependent sugar dehydrogenase [soil metagenome]
MKRLPLIAAALVLVIGVAAVVAWRVTGDDQDISSEGLPDLEVTVLADGLDHPWDVRPVGEGRLLVTQRERATLSLVDDSGVRDVDFPSDEVWVSGETGLLGLAVDPDFAGNQRIYTCQGATVPGGHDVRVIAWRLDLDASAVTQEQVLVSGFPTSTGRHGGCRLLIADDGSLYVGTGDAAQGTNPEDLTSLGGKVLRLDRTTGEPWPDNPFIDAADENQRYVESYGHRNVQGLAQRADGTVWSVEHGPDRDDEVNVLESGGDYGWNPVPGYHEDVPMTDQDLPGDQVEAAWSSGYPTIAPGGATFVSGPQWGDLDGVLAMAVLKDEEVLFLSFDDNGGLREVRRPDELGDLGRVRTVVSDTSPGHEGDLLVTTDNGDGQDALYRVSPR